MSLQAIKAVHGTETLKNNVKAQMSNKEDLDLVIWHLDFEFWGLRAVRGDGVPFD